MLKLCKNKNVHLIGEQTAAAQNDVTAKKLLADCQRPVPSLVATPSDFGGHIGLVI